MNRLKRIVGRLYMFYLRNVKRLWARYKLSAAADRKYMECRIFPHFFADDELQNILFVGVAPYTRHYNEYFKRKKNLSSLDIDPNQADFGVPEHHIIDSVENVDKYFKEGSIDCVMINGVYGWGLNDEGAVRKSIEGMRKVLKKGGILLFGWDKVPKFDPVYLDGQPYFDSLERFKINGASRIELDGKWHHVFDIYRKP